MGRLLGTLLKDKNHKNVEMYYITWKSDSLTLTIWTTYKQTKESLTLDFHVFTRTQPSVLRDSVIMFLFLYLKMLR